MNSLKKEASSTEEGFTSRNLLNTLIGHTLLWIRTEQKLYFSQKCKSEIHLKQLIRLKTIDTPLSNKELKKLVDNFSIINCKINRLLPQSQPLVPRPLQNLMSIWQGERYKKCLISVWLGPPLEIYVIILISKESTSFLKIQNSKNHTNTAGKGLLSTANSMAKASSS